MFQFIKNLFNFTYKEKKIYYVCPYCGYKGLGGRGESHDFRDFTTCICCGIKVQVSAIK